MIFNLILSKVCVEEIYILGHKVNLILFFVHLYLSSSPTSDLTHALNGREFLAPRESLLEHTNRIFRVACIHKRQDSPTSRQRLERYTCRF